MKIEEIRSKSDSELEFERENMKKEMFDLKFRSAGESASNPAQIRLLRRDIARINTVLTERVPAARKQGDS